MAQEIADSKLLDTWGSSGTKIEPDISKIIEGWQLGEQPPHEYMNWLQNTFGSKLNHILKNGIAKWDDETEYLAGASVQHSGIIWLCETTNTNSEPTDLNANWEKVAINKDLTVTVDTIADLRSISYPANTVWASGYHTKNDGAFGSHIFRLKGVKTTEIDNGGTIIIATIGGTDYVYELQYDGAVNVRWFGAKGDGVTDDTTAIQSALNIYYDIYVPNGTYYITNLFMRSNNSITGENRNGTLFIANTGASLPAISDKGTNLIFNNFTLQSYSTGIGFGFAPYSGSTWTGNDSSTYENLIIKGFEFGLREQRTVFNRYSNLQFRQNKYSIAFTQNSGTAPYIWNNTGANGWFNNNLIFENILLDGNNNGYAGKIIGDNISINGIQCSNYSGYGLLLGDSNYSTLGNYIIENYYEEFATTVATDRAIYCYGSSITLTNIDINSDLSNSIEFVSSKGIITNIKSNASPTNIIISNNSYIEVLGKVSGSYTTLFTLSGTGYVKETFLDYNKYVSTSLLNGNTYDIVLNGKSGQQYALDIFGSDNGTNYGIRAYMNGSQIYVCGSKPTYLTISTFINGNGLRDIRLSNTAGFTYSITCVVVYNPIYYTSVL